jgi:hypothetical protein
MNTRIPFGMMLAAALPVVLGACAAQVPTAIDGVAPMGVEAADTAAPENAVPSTNVAAAIPPTTTTALLPAATTTLPAPATTTTVTSTVATSTTLAPTPTTPSPPPPSFGTGTHIVGADIQAGRYEALEPGDGCSWQRLSGLSGEYRDVLADGNPQHRTIIDILADDAAVVTSGCGTWTGFQPFDEPLTEFGPGTWAIGEQILPGTYSAPGGAGCFWATVTGFDGTQTSISAIARPEGGPVEITLTTDNVGVVSDNCGSFSHIG